MARLATLISEQRGLFVPLREDIMTNRTDRSKPGLFLELFPHPLSRLYLTLLWKINLEQDGDAVVLSNVWLREFTSLATNTLKKYRRYLHTKHIIHTVPVGPGREYLYRAVGSDGRALSGETDMEAIGRLRNPERIKEVARASMLKRYRRRPVVVPPVTIEQPAMLSSWGLD
jgi:hypothetical protein